MGRDPMGQVTLLTQMQSLRVLRIQGSLTSFPDSLCLLQLPHLHALELQVLLTVAAAPAVDAERTLFSHAASNYFEEVSSRRGGAVRTSLRTSVRAHADPVVAPASPMHHCGFAAASIAAAQYGGAQSNQTNCKAAAGTHSSAPGMTAH